ncbi:lipid-A-disaccharide synthase [Pirellulaceae bacterium SH467]
MNQNEFTECSHDGDCSQIYIDGSMLDSLGDETYMGQRFFFSVGEPSGDLHAANLIRSLKRLSPTSTFRGFGGSRMIQAGLELDFDLTSMAVMGFAEVLPKLREFFRIAKLAEMSFARGEVDGVVLVDFPGFNWHIAKRAKKYGIPVYYYLPPQLWAWGGWRIAKMRKHVDHVLCNLPFEATWFESKNMPATYVGHPFFDHIAQQPLDTKFIDRWRCNHQIQVSVLPGSRDHEVKHIWPLQLEAIRKLSRQFPHVQFMVAALKDSHALWCKNSLTAGDAKLPIHIFAGKTSEIIELCDCSIMKSGSVSLEMMARGKPATVMYHVSTTTYCMAKALVRIPSISLPNLIAEEPLLPECISHGSLDSKSSKTSIQSVVEHMSKLLSDNSYRLNQRRKLMELSNQFARPGASYATAKFLLQELASTSHGTLPIDESDLPTVVASRKAA